MASAWYAAVMPRRSRQLRPSVRRPKKASASGWPQVSWGWISTSFARRLRRWDWNTSNRRVCRRGAHARGSSPRMQRVRFSPALPSWRAWPHASSSVFAGFFFFLYDPCPYPWRFSCVASAESITRRWPVSTPRPSRWCQMPFVAGPCPDRRRYRTGDPRSERLPRYWPRSRPDCRRDG